jgi:ribosomal protein L29
MSAMTDAERVARLEDFSAWQRQQLQQMAAHNVEQHHLIVDLRRELAAVRCAERGELTWE